MIFDIIYTDFPWPYNDRRLIRKDGKTAKRGMGSANIYPKMPDGSPGIMTLEELAELDVMLLMAKNAALYAWATGPHLVDIFPILDAYQIREIKKFKGDRIDEVWIPPKNRLKMGQTPMVWTKHELDGRPFFGNGYYASHNAEFCIPAIRGQMKVICNCISSLVETLVIRNSKGKIEHSEKPEEMRNRIVTLFEGCKLNPLSTSTKEPHDSCLKKRTCQVFSMEPFTLRKLEMFGREPKDGWTVIGYEVTGRDIREDIQILKEKTEE